MSSQWKTLQECWEEAGRRFPFDVEFETRMGISEYNHFAPGVMRINAFGKPGEFFLAGSSIKWVGADIHNWRLASTMLPPASVHSLCQHCGSQFGISCMCSGAQQAAPQGFAALSGVAAAPPSESRCECGAHAVGVSAHSHWCAMFKAA